MGFCGQLCTKEKLAIALHDPNTLLNNRKEILGKSIHVKNFELRNPKTPPWEGASKNVFFQRRNTTNCRSGFLLFHLKSQLKKKWHLQLSFMILFLRLFFVKRSLTNLTNFEKEQFEKVWKRDTYICHYLFLLFHNS